MIFSGPNANSGPNGPGIDAQGSVNLDGAPVWTHPPVRIGVESFPVGPLQRGPENLTTADDALLVTQYPIGEPDGFAEQDLVITFGREVTDLSPAATGTQRFTISDMSFKAGCGIGSA